MMSTQKQKIAKGTGQPLETWRRAGCNFKNTTPIPSPLGEGPPGAPSCSAFMVLYSVAQWFSMRGSGPAAPGNFLEMQILRPTLDPLKQKSRGWKGLETSKPLTHSRVWELLLQLVPTLCPISAFSPPAAWRKFCSSQTGLLKVQEPFLPSLPCCATLCIWNILSLTSLRSYPPSITALRTQLTWTAPGHASQLIEVTL